MSRSVPDPEDFSDPAADVHESPSDYLMRQYETTQAKRLARLAGREVALHRSEMP